MMNNRKTKRYISVLVVSMYLFLSLFSILMLSNHIHEAGLPVQDCPYSQGSHSLCTMDISGHIEAWQNMTRGILPLLILVPVILLFTLFVPQVVFTGLRNQKKRKEIYHTPYQELFSQGILNPKVF